MATVLFLSIAFLGDTSPRLPPLPRPDWDHWACTIKGGGSRYDDPTRPEAAVFTLCKRLPKRLVVAKLLPYFDDEDPAYARMLNVFFNALCGESMPEFKPANRAEAKQRWADWLEGR